MPRLQYAPEAYMLNADIHCLGCISEMATKAISEAGFSMPDGCGCVECLLDIWAKVKGITDRHDEYSYDSADFPKHVPYGSECSQTCDDYGCEDDEPCSVARGESDHHHEVCGTCAIPICEAI